MQDSQFDTEFPPARLEALDARASQVRVMMERATAADIASLWYQLDISAVFHDCALEGQVLGPDELDGAFHPRLSVDAARLPLYDALRRHKGAYDLVRRIGASPKPQITMELLKQLHGAFAFDEDEGRAAALRAETPLHRAYFHEICSPDKVQGNLRKLLASTNDPDDPEPIHPVVRASRFHRSFMGIFPYLETSGKVGRAAMNALLINAGYLPAVVHATERQRYYEALRGKPNLLTALIVESALSSLDAAARFLKRVV